MNVSLSIGEFKTFHMLIFELKINQKTTKLLKKLKNSTHQPFSSFFSYNTSHFFPRTNKSSSVRNEMTKVSF